MTSSAATTVAATPPATGRHRQRILLAPVTVSPTKPLTPTHLKYLLSLDMLYRGTDTFADVSFVYHHATYAGSQQVAGFWEYLERWQAGADFQAMTEEQIGELYAGYHRTERLPYAQLRPTMRRAEAGWVHPASARLLELWEEHYRLLGISDPQLGRTGPALASESEILELLVSRDLCIDARPVGAPVYLDATAAGLPLRAVLSPDGQPNYLMYLLRELVPLLDGHELVVLAHDTELRTDYQSIAHVLTALGAEVVRFEAPRVPIDGVIQSTRLGGWQGCTLGAFAGPLIEEFGLEAFRLGLRLYLVAGLGRTAPQSFATAQLRRWTRRAERLLEEHGTAEALDPSELQAASQHLAVRTGRRRYADPYQLATTLLSRNPEAPVAALLRVVMGPTEGHRPVGEPSLLSSAASLSYAGNVELALLHRRNLTEVFLTDARPVGERDFVAAALLPLIHPYYTSLTGPAGRPADPVLLLECCRQAETYAAHVFYGVELGASFVLRDWSVEVSADAERALSAGETELRMTVRTSNPRAGRTGLSGLEYEFDLWTAGSWLGVVRMAAGYVGPRTYAVLRSRRRNGPPPSSETLVPVTTGLPVQPCRVGRIRATDTLLLDVLSGPASVTAGLRLPLENPSFFDHPHDHLPGMVLVEAARQLAALATAEWGGPPPELTTMAAIESSFAAYGELDEPITMTARPAQGVGGTGHGQVAVTFVQGGTELSQMTVRMTARSAARSVDQQPPAGSR